MKELPLFQAPAPVFAGLPCIQQAISLRAGYLRRVNLARTSEKGFYCWWGFALSLFRRNKSVGIVSSCSLRILPSLSDRQWKSQPYLWTLRTQPCYTKYWYPLLFLESQSPCASLFALVLTEWKSLCQWIATACCLGKWKGRPGLLYSRAPCRQLLALQPAWEGKPEPPG